MGWDRCLLQLQTVLHVDGWVLLVLQLFYNCLGVGLQELDAEYLDHVLDRLVNPCLVGLADRVTQCCAHNDRIN